MRGQLFSLGARREGGASSAGRVQSALKDCSRPKGILGGMGVRVAYLVASMAVLAGIAACAFNPYSEPRAAWRASAKR